MQSAIFAVCAFGLIGQAAELWRIASGSRWCCSSAAALFLANIVYVATARTTLVVMAVLLLLFGLRQFGWTGALCACLVGGVLAGAVWASSPYLRERVSAAVRQVSDLRHRRHLHRGWTAARVLEKIACSSSLRRR